MDTKENLLSLVLMSIIVLVACICLSYGYDDLNELDDFLTESVLESPLDNP